jgi:hypothetical protein
MVALSIREHVTPLHQVTNRFTTAGVNVRTDESHKSPVFCFLAVRRQLKSHTTFRRKMSPSYSTSNCPAGYLLHSGSSRVLLTLKMEAKYFTETSVEFQLIELCYISPRKFHHSESVSTTHSNHQSVLTN